MLVLTSQITSAPPKNSVLSDLSLFFGIYEGYLYGNMSPISTPFELCGLITLGFIHSNASSQYIGSSYSLEVKYRFITSSESNTSMLNGLPRR